MVDTIITIVVLLIPYIFIPICVRSINKSEKKPLKIYKDETIESPAAIIIYLSYLIPFVNYGALIIAIGAWLLNNDKFINFLNGE